MDEGPDAIQKRAKDFISILSEEHGLFAICGTIRETLSSTLIENGGLRARIDLIVELLSSKLKGEREPPSLLRINPPVIYDIDETLVPSVRISPREIPCHGRRPGDNRKAFTGYKLRINASGNLNL
ncbi:MAG: hypothetical protein L6R38_006811 [Xanthoria sp. 2 TBL-2021]|nr:MAG: hypothetical protein L6R38_006811 [Xanthoria sp. 2 TBL-2021]